MGWEFWMPSGTRGSRGWCRLERMGMGGCGCRFAREEVGLQHRLKSELVEEESS